ncbi:PAC2 family protein [Glaciihabitans arcticus]|uniref:PAC2 family protein n=1 Tax=Glaciihabitans arcticus TaxID=2668039 RepID=A0A4Q9GVZ5_9MICO|nr:PAC2 family protein [Glaciihabitans arcticus]TBN56843.1 PAC2 family protein [Glaciihabitans arcticus]
MRDPAGLYELSTDWESVPSGLHLVAGLTGFADAGSAVTQLNDYLVSTLDHSVIATFDNDELLDYRARRPTIYFDQDHLSNYEPPELALRLAHDEIGQPFLLLTGYEPDFQWDRFTAAVLELVERFDVQTTTWVHAIPMPVPHTRGMGVTVSGTRSDLAEAMSVWKPHTQVPSNALHHVEYRLQESGREVVGFVLLVPHYLADTTYPVAALTALESVSAATGLIFPTDSVREDGRDFLTKIDNQVGNNAELAKLVTSLEKSHDSYMIDNPMRSPLTDGDGELPTADAIAAELEKFLSIRRSGDDEFRLP